MFEKYFASIRFYRLKRRLQRLRLQFFMATSAFDEEFMEHGLGVNTEPHLEKIMELFPTLLSAISEVETAESGVERGNIFNENTYHSIVKDEMLVVLENIHETLEHHFTALTRAHEALKSMKQDGQISLHLGVNSQLLSEYSQILQKLSIILDGLREKPKE